MEIYWVAHLVAAALGLMGSFDVVRRSRRRAATRFRNALNAYADRQIADERRRKA
jgi:hypothetical protein